MIHLYSRKALTFSFEGGWKRMISFFFFSFSSGFSFDDATEKKKKNIIHSVFYT